MEKIRRGNDIDIQWSVYAEIEVEVVPYSLVGKDLSIYMKNQFGSIKVDKFSVDGNVVRWTFWGKDQKQSGLYSIELIENDGEKGMHTVDKRDAFQLVHHSCETGGSKENGLKTIAIQFSSNVGIVGSSVGSGLQYSVERTVYPTRLESEGNEPTDVEITEEERAYNIETYDMAWNRMEPVFVSHIGIHFNVIVMSDEMAAYNVVTHFSNAFGYNGLYSFTITITKEGDAIFSSKQIQTGGGSATPSDMNSDFSNDF